MDYLGLSLNIVSEFLELIPNYEQRKKNQFYKLKRDYETEKVKPWNQRDDDKLMNLRDELSSFLESFYEEIKK